MTVTSDKPETTERISAVAPAGDERISFRGPVQRLLISPEIGALIGAFIVWAFFWSVGQKFGNAGQTANFLDVAAPLGIMAVAVALLMIGGEFDLSAGIITGTSGIFVILFAQHFHRTGTSLWIAIPLAFLVAGFIGWLNGTLVNKTGLPSFIVTLGTFFVLEGANLVFAKRIAEKVTVSGLEKTGSFDFFRKVFASEHTKKPFSLRDPLFLTMVCVGGLLLLFGLLEMSLVRRDKAKSSGLGLFVVGLALSLGGFLALHKTTGISNNTIFGLVSATGLGLVIVGLAQWRYEPRVAEGAGMGLGTSKVNVLLGVGAVVVAIVLAKVMRTDEGKVILSFMPAGLRPIAGAIGGLIGLGLSVRRIQRMFRNDTGAPRPGPMAMLVAVLFALFTILAAVVITIAVLELTTMQALRAGLVAGLAAFGLVKLLIARGVVGRSSRQGQLLVGVLISLSLVALAFMTRATSKAVRFRSGLFTALLLFAVLLLANALVEHRQRKRTAFDRAIDRRGKDIAIVGITVAVLGLAMRLLFTEQPFRISVLWLVLAVALGSFVLFRTKYGNWIFAVGGNKEAARAIGVPVDKVKVGLFMTTALAGCFVGMMVSLRLTSVQANQGLGDEFEYIIAAVVGGNLMTGGYGSAAGAALGAIILAMVKNGIPSAGWNTDVKFAVIGAVLLLAVFVNSLVRKKAQEAR